MTTRTLPAAGELTYWQHLGHACVWCRAPLTHGATSAGRAEGRAGAHDLSVEVFQCPSCHVDLLREGVTR